MLTVTSRLQIPDEELEFTFTRSSGPGGQNVNKVSSKAQLRWQAARSPSLPEEVRERFLARFGSRLTGEGELLIASQRYRDQRRNVEDCLEKLRAMLREVAVAPRRRKPTRPKRSSIERRLSDKKLQGARKRERRGLGE
jgi:ribosome-associated protein